MADILNKAEYMENAQGALIPKKNIKPIDLLRDDITRRLIDLAKNQSNKIAEFRNHCFDEIAAFIDVSAAEYGLKTGGEKGNVTLTTFDGKYKVQRAFADKIIFDERLVVAKGLIDECIKGWSGGSNGNIVTLVNSAFQVDKKGNISVARILGLRQVKIDDEKWKKAMDAIGDSLKVASSKGYIRFYERVGTSDQYRAIPIDIASD